MSKRCPLIGEPPAAIGGPQVALKTRAAVPLGEHTAIDLKSPDLYKRDRHFTAFKCLRREQPVYWNPESDSTGFWALTNYDHVLTVLQDTETFSPATEHGGMRIFNLQDVSAEPLLPHIFSMVPPAHRDAQSARADPVWRSRGGARILCPVQSALSH